MKSPVCFLIFFLSFTYLLAQPAADPDSDELATATTLIPPKIFVNCSNTRCFDDYVRTELSFFDFVRDRFVCDVEVLVVSFNTAASGREYTLTFLGQGRLERLGDTLRFVTRQTDTEDMIRKQLVRTLKQGLVRYVIDTDFLQQLSINFPKRKVGQPIAAAQRDAWNYWVFNIGGTGTANGESNRKFRSLSGNVRINRVTPRAKFSFSTYYNDNRNRYQVNGQDIRVQNVAYGLSSLYVRAFSEHWSAGGFYRGSHSIYQNIDFSQSLAPALEYSVFPISQVTRRQLRWVYQAGMRSLKYIEPTIFDRTRETLPYHQITGIFGVTEPWGTLSAELSGYQYLHDRRKNRLSFDLELSWRIIEGLFLRLNGGASLINNQISLARSSIKSEDALLNGRQLPTNFNYNSSVGLNFTFGSINNSVVNPRFSGVD